MEKTCTYCGCKLTSGNDATDDLPDRIYEDGEGVCWDCAAENQEDYE